MTLFYLRFYFWCDWLCTWWSMHVLD